MSMIWISRTNIPLSRSLKKVSNNSVFATLKLNSLDEVLVEIETESRKVER